MSLAVLIFDVDGTLIDSAPDLAAAASALLAEHALPPLETAEIAAMVGDAQDGRTSAIDHFSDLPEALRSLDGMVLDTPGSPSAVEMTLVTRTSTRPQLPSKSMRIGRAGAPGR